MTIPAPLATFTETIGGVIGEPDEARLLPKVAEALADLVATDSWLPDAYAVPHPDHYTQYLLYRDPQARFSVVSFVWAPGQGTPVHDHTVWGAVGVLRGRERSQRFVIGSNSVLQPVDLADTLWPGEVETVSPRIGDIHQVSNAQPDGVTVSIHVYGADIGTVARHIYTDTGGVRTFISGYANTAATPPFAA